MLTTIRVRPAAGARRAFARWAIEQTPKVRTASHAEFAVPADLFTHMPEDLLVGSMVDGHRYRSPAEDADQQERTGVPGVPLPVVPSGAYPPGSVPLDEHPGDGDDDQAADTEPATAVPPVDEQHDAAQFACDICPRTFDTERGRNTHRRQAHTEEAP
ncbi:hypothetical protein [[Kitasatospora] papulosa]|uniref:hypothetical protein n=1 Tax=[Kitasatospora] papulosa TaxID=1464011 RepID=UPI00369D8448